MSQHSTHHLQAMQSDCGYQEKSLPLMQWCVHFQERYLKPHCEEGTRLQTAPSQHSCGELAEVWTVMPQMLHSTSVRNLWRY